MLIYFFCVAGGGWKDDTAANGNWDGGNNAGAPAWDDGAPKANGEFDNGAIGLGIDNRACRM